MTKKYRKNVGICLLDESGRVFLGNRIGYENAYQMPQGGVDDGEKPLNAALRELFEETGIPAHDIKRLATYPNWLKYQFPPDAIARGNHKGQQQKWYLFLYVGDGNIDVTTAKTPEFDGFCWETPAFAVKNIVDFKRDIYTRVFQKFSDLGFLDF